MESTHKAESICSELFDTGGSLDLFTADRRNQDIVRAYF